MIQSQVRTASKTRVDRTHDNDQDNTRNERTILVSRIPTKYNEDMIHQLIQNTFLSHFNDTGSKAVNLYHENDNDATKELPQKFIEQVTFVYPKEDNDTRQTHNRNNHEQQQQQHRRDPILSSNASNNNDDRFHDRPYKKQKTAKITATTISSDDMNQQQHCGFGFVRLLHLDYADVLINTIKSIRFDKQNAMTTPTPSTTKKYVEQLDVTNKGMKKPKYHTIYIGPVTEQNETNGSTDSQGRETTMNTSRICFLWTEERCPYNDTCKFQHVGPGKCLVSSKQEQLLVATLKRKKIKCFNYRKGKCKFTEDTCPYSHNFDVLSTSTGARNGNITNNTGRTTMDSQDNDNIHCKPCDDPNNVVTNDDGTCTITKKMDSEKDCFDYIMKNGKCRKLLQNKICIYKHDSIKLQIIQQKKLKQEKKKKKQELKHVTAN